MIIGVDARSLVGSKTGIGHYTLQVLKHLVQLDSKNQYVLFSNKHFELPSELNDIEINITEVKSDILWMQRTVPKLLNRYQIDLFWGPGYTIPLGCPKRVKRVITVHDMVSFRLPETLPMKTVLHNKIGLPMYIEYSDHIIADSESTRSDIKEFLNVPGKDKITTIPLGVSSHYFKKNHLSKEVLKKYGIDPPYILFVGTIEPRKNLQKLISGYCKITRKNKPKLVIVGKFGWKYNHLINENEQIKGLPNVKFLDYVADSDLPSLYEEAEMFVYPSLYEGFGLPLLEAMASGAPVITSKTSSMKEVVGDAAIIINPYSEHEIANAITNLLNDRDLQQRLIKSGKKRALEFSWGSTAEKTLKVFELVMNS